MNKVKEMLEQLHAELRNDKNYSAADKLLPIIKEAGKNGWIPCSKRLPDYDEPVIISYAANPFEKKSPQIVGTMVYRGWCEFHWREGCVTAWMPLPEPFDEK